MKRAEKDISALLFKQCEISKRLCKKKNVSSSKLIALIENNLELMDLAANIIFQQKHEIVKLKNTDTFKK